MSWARVGFRPFAGKSHRLQSPTEAIDKLSAVRSHRYFEKQQRPQPEIRQQNLRRHVESTLVASAYFEQKHRSQHFLTYVTYYQTELSHTFERQGRTVEHLSQLLVETASRGDPSIYPLGSFLVAAKAILSNHSNFVAACGALATLVAHIIRPVEPRKDYATHGAAADSLYEIHGSRRQAQEFSHKHER